MKLNLNAILLFLGWVALAAPTLDSVAKSLNNMTGIPYAAAISQILGGVALMLQGLALAVPMLRSGLAKIGVATPPGARAPWNPERDLLPHDAPVQINATGGAHSTEDITSPLPARSKGPLRPGEGGSVRMAMLFGMALTFFLAVCMFSWAARAQEPTPAPASTCPPLAICVGQWTIQPASAIAFQVIPSTGEYRQGAALVGLSAMTDQFGLPLGAVVFCGAGFGAGIPNGVAALQCSGGLAVTEWGAVLAGAQWYRATTGGLDSQLVLSVAGTLSSGSTTSQAKALKRQLMEERAVVVALNDALTAQATRAEPPTIETTIVPRVTTEIRAAIVPVVPPAQLSDCSNGKCGQFNVVLPDVASKPMGFGGTSSTEAR